MKGNFIVFEGGEGSGKTRHSTYVAQRLQQEGYDVVHTLEPGGSTIGQAIRSIILNESDEPLHDRAELFLFLADRAQHVAEVIVPAIERGAVVICDRFSGSTFAYQLGGRRLPDAEFVRAMEAYARAALTPDLVLYLDIDPETGVQRKSEGDEAMNRMDKEALSFHERVRSYFLHMVEENDHWTSMSTAGPKEENAERIYSLVHTQLQS